MGVSQITIAKARNIICNGLVLLLPIPWVSLAYISIGEKMPDMTFNLKTGKTSLKRSHNIRALSVPVLGLFKRIKRQRHEPLQLVG
jgi:hypothetical protein